MNIDSLNRGNALNGTDNKSNKKVSAYREESKEAKVKESSDKLEISAEALKLQPIRAKIAQGFYDNPEVLRSVSEKLLKEIDGL